MTLRHAKEVTGGLSDPGKMPGFAFNIPAWECPVGKAMVKVKGSTCFKCYANGRNRYAWEQTKTAMARRFDKLREEEWVDSMVRLITHYSEKIDVPYFRWHDSGDIQGAWHLKRIFSVCRRTSGIQHWLPTKEVRVVRDVMKSEEIPLNLNIRISAYMVDKLPTLMADGCTFSTVHTDPALLPGASICPAPKQGNQCGSCRSCWDKAVPHTSYKEH